MNWVQPSLLAVFALVLGVVCMLGRDGIAAEQVLTYPDLVRRMWDPESLARLPEPGERGALFSSYDRSSRYDEAADRYLNWGANEDQQNGVRKEGEALVLAEMKGPGCIWRTWSAQPGEGHVQIFLDDQTTPVVDLPFKGYFDGRNAPFDRPELVYVAARGCNNYTPIPYQKSCKIVAQPGWGAFYHFNYTTFPAGTKVPTFNRECSAEDAKALDQANALFAGRGQQASSAGAKMTKNLCAEAGQTVEIASLKGPAAVTLIRARLADLPAAPADRVRLRELCLKITWDGEDKAAVWAPWGDFFGTAPGAHEYCSLMSGLTADGWWYACWYMPFGSAARIEFVNDSASRQAVAFEISSEPLAKPIEQYGRFHAKWHRDIFIPENLDRTIDWPLLVTEGRGRYVGTMLHVFNPYDGWWGEGDEKFFVDGEKFPSTFGTGSEDYFGYAWCDWNLFQKALHGQTVCENQNKGHISVYRWHLGDNVPFQTSFHGYIEKYFSNRRPTLYAATAFWYLAPGGKDPYAPVPVGERNAYWDQVDSKSIPRGRGGMEADSFEVREQTGGRHGVWVTPQYDDGKSPIAGKPLGLWVDARPGEHLEMKVHWCWGVEPGRYRLLGYFYRAPDFGIMQVHWNGRKTGEPIDFYAKEMRGAEEVDLGVYDLQPGIQLLKFEVAGKHPAAKPRYGVCLDCIRLVREK